MGKARGSPALLAPGPGLLLLPAAPRLLPAAGPSLRPGRASRGPTPGDPIWSDNPDPDIFRSYPRPERPAGCLCNCCTTFPAVIHGLFLELPAPRLQARRTDTWKEKKAALRARKALSSGAGCLPGIKNNWCFFTTSKPPPPTPQSVWLLLLI